MSSRDQDRSESSTERRPAASDARPAQAKDGPATAANPAGHPDQDAAPPHLSVRSSPAKTSAAEPPRHRRRKWLLLAGMVAVLAVAGYFLIPWIQTALNTVSTD